MKLLLTLLVAALAALGGQHLGSARAAHAPEPAAEGLDLARVVTGIRELRRENERLAAEIERRSSALVAGRAQAGEIGEDEIAAALERWRAAHPEETRLAAAGRAARAVRARPDELDLASVPMSEIVQYLAREGLGDPESQEIFQRLREAGRIDEFVAAIEALAAEDPENADLQVALGVAYLQKLFGVGNAPEAGPLAMKSDAAFDRALELDDHNWAARFTKAVSLSNWPAFLGRGPEAIEHFEVLLEQQAAVPKRDEFAMTYLFLGNMQQAAGESDKAIATWKAGLELFPNMEDLQRALANAQSADPTTRPASR
jgi:tetratricopeptide (TPR) repeat protein